MQNVKNSNFICKIFCIVLMAIISFICISPRVSANYEFEYDGMQHSLPDLPVDSENFSSQYFSIFKNSDGTYQLLSYVGFDPDTMYIINNNSNVMGIVDLEGNANTMSARVKFWTANDSEWTLNSWQPYDSTYTYYGGAETMDKFVYTNVNIRLATANGS